MKMSRATVCLGVAIMIALASLGCGSGSSTPPPVGAVAATTHPLVAQYTISHFDSGMSAWVEFGTDTNYGRQTSAVSSSSAGLAIQKLNVLVAGMLPQTTYHMRAHASWPGGSWVDQDHTFTTGALPGSSTAPQFATFSVSTPTPGLTPAPGVELLNLVNPNPTGPAITVDVVTDIQGRVIWYCPLNGVPIKPMPNGHFMANIGTDILEVDLACNTVRDVSTAQMNQALKAAGHSFPPLNQFHHDMLVLPNGHWILLAQVTTNFTNLQGYPGTTGVLGDVLMDVDPSGNVGWAWSSFEQINALPIGMDIDRHLFGLPDWTHSNALVYTADGNLLLSMRAQSWVLKIDYANGTGSGNILWRLGQDGDFQLTNGDSSQWFYGQHFPNVINVTGSTTTLAVFDDGDYRIVPNTAQCSSGTSVPPCYTRATIYQVDESANLATLQWQYLPGFYTFWGGSVDVLSNGDVEFDSSEPNPAVVGSPVIEVSQTDSPQIVWEMNITGAYAYRAYRIPSLYPGVTWQQ